MDAFEARYLLRLVGLGVETGGGRAAVEVAGEDWLEEGAEDNLGAASLGKGHPENEDELEGEVEWEPVDSVDSALKDGQEGIDDPVRQPLSVIARFCGEQSLERVVGGDRKADGVDEEVGGDVEEDQEEVEGSKAKDDVDLGHIGLPLKVVEGRVLGELLVELGYRMLSSVLKRSHCGELNKLNFVWM